MSKQRSYNQKKTARLNGGRISPTVLEEMKSHAEELGLSMADYLYIAEHNFYSNEPWLICKICGTKNVVDDDQIHVTLFKSDGCRVCGADLETAYS